MGEVLSEQRLIPGESLLAYKLEIVPVFRENRSENFLISIKRYSFR